jgi:leader peptidase (prepilin peptidase)/N-methyltransferase
VPSIGEAWGRAMGKPWFAAAMGSVLGAMVGAFVVWVTRILGTLGFGRLAMGLGDVHLMFGVGAILGAGASTVAFFLAPFAGMAVALYLLAFGQRREIPYGPYLSIGSAATVLFYCPIADWLRPGLTGLGQAIREMLGG